LRKRKMRWCAARFRRVPAVDSTTSCPDWVSPPATTPCYLSAGLSGYGDTWRPWSLTLAQQLPLGRLVDATDRRLVFLWGISGSAATRRRSRRPSRPFFPFCHRFRALESRTIRPPTFALFPHHAGSAVNSAVRPGAQIPLVQSAIHRSSADSSSA
jgi:hypothetical protein